MSVFAGPVDILVTGLVLSVATAILLGPILYLRAPVHTDEGVSRVGIELTKRASEWMTTGGDRNRRLQTRYET